ncbi:13931_t:CDS:2 [Funneliformis mosseae]|uniref:13931_t:CDS:1 n=1 Tax=Funneliformis mosseae TaxID=27381 RepID=A0A9N8VQ23_FUNMO|nr:13931_t:CDS:2 [Funneliformis mosseae]
MEKALLEVLEMAICQNFKESSKFVRDHLSYEELRTKLEELYSLYYEISQKEKCEIFKDNAKEIIQGLLNMSLTDD